MKINRLFYAFFASVFTLITCEEIVDNVDLPDLKPKLVVFSYISPGADSIFAQVSLSRSITEPRVFDHPFISDAEVSITQSNGHRVSLQFDSQKKVYYAAVESAFLVQGAQYRIDVKTPDGKQVDAVCTLPAQNTTLRIIKVDSVKMEMSTSYTFRLEFDDIVGKPDYYRIIPKVIIRHEWDGDYQIFEWNANIRHGEEFISAKDRDGKTFVVETYAFDWVGGGTGGQQLMGMKFYLLATDEHYYHLHRSLERYIPDNPFTEPTIIYSNINEGLGVFAGYNPFILEYSF